MSKRRTPVTAYTQPSLFDQPRVQVAGIGRFVRETLVDVLAAAKERGQDRFRVAEEMSRLDPDCEVTKRMLDNYCAPSAADHRLPLELVPALYHVTRDARLVTLVAEACDHKVVPGAAAAIGRLFLLEMEEKRIKAEKAAVMRQMSPKARDFAKAELDRRSGR